MPPLGGMALSQRIPTPQWLANRLCHLVTLPATGQVHIADLAGCAQGNLLAPWSGQPTCRLYGIEISDEQVAIARRRLPHAEIVRAPFEAVRLTSGSISLAISNPPYIRLDNGKRAEYVALTVATQALVAGGVTLQIVPARQLDGVLANHLARHYTQVRCWRFPDGDPNDDSSFQKYTQIIIGGVKRGHVLDQPDPAIRAQLLAWKFDTATQQWAGGTAPPLLPDTPLTDCYPVPIAPQTPDITVLHADDALLAERLVADGVHHGQLWRAATAPQPQSQHIRPLMPPVGPAHIGALILSGLLDGDILHTTTERPFVLTTWAVKTRIAQEVNSEQREQQVVSVVQNEPEGALSVLWLDTGAVETHVGGAAYTFLAPYLPTLAQTVLTKHEPLYQLDPARWEVRVALTIAQDKHLPGQPYPGLAPAQMHRSFALRRALWQHGQPVLLNGEAGVGKTRQLILLSALLGYYWQHTQGRDVTDWGLQPAEFAATRRPRWVKHLRQAWTRNPRLPGQAPQALPVIVACPRRVVPTWQQEFAGAFPQAAYWGRIESMADIRAFFAACATSAAPICVATIAHSTKGNRGLHFAPGAARRSVPVTEAVLDPPPAQHDQLEPITRGHTVVAYRDIQTGQILTHTVERTLFFCPHCGQRVEDVPHTSLAAQTTAADDDLTEPEPVTDDTYFTRMKRFCKRCSAPLWQYCRTAARERKHGSIGFARWSQLVAAGLPERPTTRPRRERALARLNGDGAWDWTGDERINPYGWLHRHYRGAWGLTIIDESHIGRGAQSDIARAFHLLWR